MESDKDKKPEETPLKQIRTYQGDVADALEKQHESLVSIQQVEQERRKNTPSQQNSKESFERRKELFYLSLGSLVLVVLGVVGGWFAYNEFIRKTAPPPIAAPLNRFVYADSEISIDVTNISRINLIKILSENTVGVPSGKLKHVILENTTPTEKKLLTSGDFLAQLGTLAPGNLVRALDPLFMFGAYGESTFLIFKIVSFENAFAGMLSWEKNIKRDLGPILASAKLLESLPPDSVFVDLRYRNKDSRALMLDDEAVLLYSFLDNDTIIITDNIATLRVLIERLTQEKLSR